MRPFGAVIVDGFLVQAGVAKPTVRPWLVPVRSHTHPRPLVLGGGCANRGCRANVQTTTAQTVVLKLV